MDGSGNPADTDCAAFGRLPEVLEIGGVDPTRWPLPGNELDGDRNSACALGEVRCPTPDLASIADVLAGCGEGGDSIRSSSRAFSGSSCSDRKRTSRPWMRRTFFSRSMHA